MFKESKINIKAIIDDETFYKSMKSFTVINNSKSKRNRFIFSLFLIKYSLALLQQTLLNNFFI